MTGVTGERNAGGHMALIRRQPLRLSLATKGESPMHSRDRDPQSNAPLTARRDVHRQVAVMFGLTVLGAMASMIALLSLQGS